MLNFSATLPGNYYIVVRHRNHLAVMSANPVTLSSSSILYDFTTNQTKAYGISPMKLLGAGVFGLIGGDADRNGIINGTDFNVYNPRLVSIVSGYEQSDFDLNGHVDGSDFNLFNPNLVQILTSLVP
jgi:hypothetical protein